MTCHIYLDKQLVEDEIHTFEQCKELIEHDQSEIKFNYIFGSLEQQVKAIQYFTRIITKRNLILDIEM